MDMMCCSCGKTWHSWSVEAPGTLRNLVSLHKLAPVPGTGWEHLAIDMPAIGAVALVCDDCLADKEIIWAWNGDLYAGRYIRVTELEPLPEIWEMRLAELVAIEATE